MSRASMDRRAFLLLRTRGRERVMELSCERLYMRWANARSGVGQPAMAGAAGVADESDGEPPTEIVTETVTDLWRELEVGLADSNVVSVSGREWLADSAFGEVVGARLSAFVAGGGRVE